MQVRIRGFFDSRDWGVFPQMPIAIKDRQRCSVEFG